MNRVLRDVRLIPIVLFATISLLALKVSGLVFDGGYTLGRADAGATTRANCRSLRRRACRNIRGSLWLKSRPSPERQRYRSSPGRRRCSISKGHHGDVTGSVGAAEEKPSDPALKVSDKPPDPPKLEVAGAAIPLEPGRIASRRARGA